MNVINGVVRVFLIRSSIADNGTNQKHLNHSVILPRKCNEIVICGPKSRKMVDVFHYKSDDDGVVTHKSIRMAILLFFRRQHV